MSDILKQAQKLLEEQGDNIDAILIFAGTNDYNAGVPLGEWYTETEIETEVSGRKMERRKHREPVLSETTFKGRINQALTFLKTHYPTKQIILLHLYIGDTLASEITISNRMNCFLIK